MFKIEKITEYSFNGERFTRKEDVQRMRDDCSDLEIELFETKEAAENRAEELENESSKHPAMNQIGGAVCVVKVA